MTRDRAEISRQNGAKSKGPKTERGRAIVSQNAVKHGITAIRPPVLLCEDSEAFSQIMESLAQEHQPSTPTEQFFLMQLGMAMHKQARLWRAESAAANYELLKLQLAQEFPEADNLASRLEYNPLIELGDERSILSSLLKCFEGVNESSDLDELRASVLDAHEGIREDVPSCPVVHRVAAIAELLHRSSTESIHDAIPIIRSALQSGWIQKRIEGINEAIANYNGLKERLEEARKLAKTLQKTDLYSRYQNEINAQINNALDRLEACKQRNQ